MSCVHKRQLPASVITQHSAPQYDDFYHVEEFSTTLYATRYGKAQLIEMIIPDKEAKKDLWKNRNVEIKCLITVDSIVCVSVQPCIRWSFCLLFNLCVIMSSCINSFLYQSAVSKLKLI